MHLPRTHASKEEVSSLGCAELAGMDRDRQAAAHMKTVNIMIALHLTSEELLQRPKGEYCFGPCCHIESCASGSFGHPHGHHVMMPILP